MRRILRESDQSIVTPYDKPKLKSAAVQNVTIRVMQKVYSFLFYIFICVSAPQVRVLLVLLR